MTCDVIRAGRPAMAKAGWSEDEIAAMELELELAKRKAEASSFASGETRAEQQAAIKRAEDAAIKVAHDRHHRRLGDMARAIGDMTAWKKAHPNEHYNPHAIKVAAGEKEKK